MIHYKPIKIIINSLSFAKVIINIVIRYYSFLVSNITNQGPIFTLKFWSLLCYYFGIN